MTEGGTHIQAFWEIKRGIIEIEDRIEIASRMAPYGPIVEAVLPKETAEL